jgi:photoactive yellow protein
MTDQRDAARDLAWYRDRWEELMDLLPTSEPEEVVDQVRELQVNVLDEEAEALDEMGLTDAEEAKTVLRRIFQRLQKLRRENQALQHLQDAVGADSPDEIAASIDDLRARVQTLEEQQQVLAEAGYDRPQHVLQALASMEEQLDELYGEKEATERSVPGTRADGDTFDQLQALMAREEKLQRELGVSSPDAVVEMVEGLTDQLEDLYVERDADTTADSIFAPAPEQPTAEDRFEDELGVSDPDAILTMMDDLKAQLDELYDDRRRLAEHNLEGADDAIRMLESMQNQLEALYERQERLSTHGLNGVDHALSMIESMEAQLDELYDERHHGGEQEAPEELTARIEELETKLTALRQEKTSLQETRDRLQDQFDELEDELGTDDPAVISDLIGSLEAQLEDLYEEREEDTRRQTLPDDEPLLDADTLATLDDQDDDALDALPVGAFCVDDQGRIQRANEKALRWPDVGDDAPETLVGQHFFEDVAPAADNALFRGRFEEGVEAGTMDERFLYTYVGEQVAPTNLAVHLYRSSTDSTNWVMFRLL